MLSVFVSWAAFQKSRKKAYVFILAFFLLPLVVEPVSRFFYRRAVKQQFEAYEKLQAASDVPLTEMEFPQPLFTAKRTIAFPIGPLLLFTGIWYLYKQEERQDSEQNT